jgi:hypothetical protein
MRRIGIAISGGPNPAEIIDLVVLAESLGYEWGHLPICSKLLVWMAPPSASSCAQPGLSCRCSRRSTGSPHPRCRSAP